jgi:hypothetical protein
MCKDRSRKKSPDVLPGGRRKCTRSYKYAISHRKIVSDRKNGGLGEKGNGAGEAVGLWEIAMLREAPPKENRAELEEAEAAMEKEMK